MAPGEPTALITAAVLPFTVTWSGELTGMTGLGGNGFPGSGLGRVGPRLVAKKDKISPGVAGLEILTGADPFAWVKAGSPPVITISGCDIGMTYKTSRMCPPPIRRGLEGA